MAHKTNQSKSNVNPLTPMEISTAHKVFELYGCFSLKQNYFQKKINAKF